MNRLAIVPRALLLALTAMIGIVGMLLSTGAGDVVFFLLAAVPLALGGWYAWRMRGTATVR